MQLQLQPLPHSSPPTRQCVIPQQHDGLLHVPEGEWSVATLSMVPSASPCSSRPRFSSSRRGGAHLNLQEGSRRGQAMSGSAVQQQAGHVERLGRLPACLSVCLAACLSWSDLWQC